MKKLLLLPVFIFALVSCSTDEEQIHMNEAATSEVGASAFRVGESPQMDECTAYLAGHTNINVDAGFGNPMVEFYAEANIIQQDNTKHIMYLEVQPLADCEDMEIALGPVSTFKCKFQQTIAPQLIKTLSPAQLPASCYKWRLVVSSSQVINSSVIGVNACTSVSDWYEAPLF